jgi:hypothetical protein
MRPYYDTCPECGAHLDPGERCDCREAATAEGKETEPVPQPITARH